MIYLDNNATTMMHPSVREAMEPFLTDCYGNPSSPCTFGRKASNAIAEARDRVAALVGARPSQVVFTSGGTESNNAVLSGFLNGSSTGIVISAVEHHAVLNTCNHLAGNGICCSKVGVSSDGMLDLDALDAHLNEKTGLVSVMAANNETGVLFPLAEVAERARHNGVLFHSDAVQAVGKVPLSFEDLGLDFMTLSGHKLHGPKGTGALVIRDDKTFRSLLHGGEQEQHRRAGTENVAGIVGLGAAAELMIGASVSHNRTMAALRDDLEEGIKAGLSDVSVVGSNVPRLPNTSLLLFERVEAEALLALLDMEGICCSTGSACTAGSVEPSHVLLAMGYGPDRAKRALRFSLSQFSTKDEVDRTVQKTVELALNLQ